MPDTLDLTHMEQVGSVCSRGMAHRLLLIYLYQWGKPHLLGTDAVKARQTVPETTTNTRIALFISVQKNMQLSATASIHFPNRNVEIHPSSSTGLLPQAKVFTFSFAKNLWNSRHKSQSTKTNTSKSLFFIADNPAYSLQLFKCHSICEVCWNGFFRL